MHAAKKLESKKRNCKNGEMKDERKQANKTQ